MSNLKILMTDDDVWVYSEDNPSWQIQYNVLVGANLDVERVTISGDKFDWAKGEISTQFPEVTFHDMRGEVSEEPVIVYDDPEEFLRDFLSPQWPPPD